MSERDEMRRAGAEIAEGVRKGLRDAAEPDRAPAMQAYMKSDMPFHGVKAPVRRRIVQAVVAAHPHHDLATWLDAVANLWRRATRREERYAAIDLLQLRRGARLLDASVVAEVEEMIRDGEWALREYGKTDPAWVAAYIERSRGSLAPLSIREASRYI